MGKPKKKHKKAKQLPLSKEEQIFQAARDLAAEIGISYSEALGFTLGIKDVTYGLGRRLYGRRVSGTD